MLWGKNREKWKGRQLLGVKPRTPLAWATSALPLTHNSQIATNLYFCLITSKFIYFQHEARCSEHLDCENYSAWVFLLMEKISSQTLAEFWWHILTNYQVCNCGIQYHLCSTYGRSRMRVVGRPAVSGRALAAQAKCPGFESWWLCYVYQKERTFVTYNMPVLSEDWIM